MSSSSLSQKAKIFYSSFIYNEETKKTKLVYSTYEDQGFYIYNLETKEKHHIDTCYFVLIIEQIPNTNDFLIVGNDKPNYIRISKERNKYENEEYIQVKDRVNGLKVSSTHVIIEYSSSIEIRLLQNLIKVIFSSHMHTTTTQRRPNLCLHPKGVAAFNGAKKGNVTFCDLRKEEPGEVTSDKHKEVTFHEHNNPVMTHAISPDCTMAASSSENGTAIKLYKIPPCPSGSFEFIRERKRGAKDADVYSIAFSPDSTLVSVISSTGTIHVFYTAFCLTSTEYKSERLTLNASNFINMTFLDDKTLCLFFHEDGSLRMSSIDSLASLNTNAVHVLAIEETPIVYNNIP